MRNPLSRKCNLLLASVICMFLTAPVVHAQSQSVSGVVRSAKDNQPVPGVTVQVTGTINSTLTDAKGNYVLKGISSSDSLLFTSIGFLAEVLPIENRTQVNIILTVEVSSLDQVVVVGYGTQKKRDLTGSIKTINMGDIPPGSNTNLMQALRGYAPGLNVQGGGSVAGDEPQLSVRGQTSLSANDRPLIVLDGIIFQGSINDINVADVERIDVLKDASAAAVYGSRSANGVLIITTKRGKGSKPSIGFNGYYGFQDFSNNPVKMMNAKQYASRLVDYNYEQFLYGWYAKKPTSSTDQGGKPVRPDVNDPKVVTPFLRSQDEVNNYLAGRSVNWTDEVTRVAPLQNYDLNISGASPRSTYYISGSYIDQKGVMINDQFKRTILTAKADTKITDWLTLGLNTSYSKRDQSGLETTLEYARNASPLASKYDSLGNYPVDFNGEFLMRHPLRNTLVSNKDLRNNLFVTAYAKVQIPKINGLTYDFNYSNNTIESNNNTFIPSSVYEGQATRGQATITNARETSWIINNILTYAREFSSNHRVNATLLYTREKRDGNSSSSYAEQFQNQSLGYNNLSFGSFARVGSAAFDENTLAFMGRANYVFKNRYMITGTVRKDGYSGFGASRKYATFPSLSVAWIASDEKFMASTKSWLDVFKFRASYGLNGNQGIGRYSSLSRMGVNGYVFGTSPSIGIIPTTLGNSDLGWESTSSLNFGLDFAILNRRISGTIDLYTSHTDDVLVTRSLPGATGYLSVWTNIGKIDNKGVEIELSTVNIQGPVQWESRFVFAINRDKINTLYGDGKDDLGNSWFIGKPISAIYDYKREGGIWTEEELYKGTIHKNFYPGQFKLADLNKDGQIAPGNDRMIVGYATPNYRFSISNNISYRNFTLSFLVNSIQGGNGYYIQSNKSFLEATSDFDYAQRVNLPAVRENWLPGNGVNNAPAVYNYPLVASGNYQDRSFVRLQDLSLVYKLGVNPIKALKVEGLQIYVSGKNLYTWTNWEGYDPEIGGNSLPLMRSLIGGFRINL